MASEYTVNMFSGWVVASYYAPRNLGACERVVFLSVTSFSVKSIAGLIPRSVQLQMQADVICRENAGSRVRLDHCVSTKG
jgi:hypothetical protein